jgi:ABC-type uncharacterized transport system ATPase subunit
MLQESALVAALLKEYFKEGKGQSIGLAYSTHQITDLVKACFDVLMYQGGKVRS